MAHVLEPPGLGVRFASRAEMNRHLPHELRQHLDWLAQHGEPVPADALPVFRIAEEVSVLGDFESGDDVGFYGPDERPVTPPEIERSLRIAGHAHEDLLALVAPLDAPALDWARDDRTRSIRRVLRHAVGAELWYMGRIIEDPDRVPVPDIIAEADRRCDATEDQVERVRIVWPAFQRWARSLTSEQRGRVTVPTWWSRRPGERWSARKMLRRCTEHCREHARSIERILADFNARRGGT